MQIASIQRLRAAAALAVVFGHAQSESTVAASRIGDAFHGLFVLPWGAGVDLFFVISGFIMVVASDRLFGQPHAAGRFMTRRLKRIVPLYWLCTTAYLAIQFALHKVPGTLDVAASYLFVPRDIFGDGVCRPLFTLGWTLNYEMFFYAVFALALRLPAFHAVLAVTIALAAAVVGGTMVALPPGPLQTWTQPIVLEFVAGMWLGLGWRNGFAIRSEGRVGLAVVAMLVLFLDAMGSSHQVSSWITPTDLLRVVGWGLPCAMLVAAAALTARPTDSSRTARSALPLVALGDASYALYLVHPFVVGSLVRVWSSAIVRRPDGLFANAGFWPMIGLATVGSVIAAVVVHRWLEQPLAAAMASRHRQNRPDATSMRAPSPAGACDS